MPPMNAFVFDLDGTLLDTMPDLVATTNSALEEFGLPTHSPQAIQGFVGNGLRDLISQATPADTPQQTQQAILERWKQLYDQHGNQLTRPYPHIPQLLETLKSQGKKLAVLSNKYDKGAKTIVSQFFPNTFDLVFGEGPVPRKPDPEGLLKIMLELGVTPESTAFVGDSVGDMKVAKRAGTLALAATWGYQPLMSLMMCSPDALLEKPLDLLAYL